MPKATAPRSASASPAARSSWWTSTASSTEGAEGGRVRLLSSLARSGWLFAGLPAPAQHTNKRGARATVLCSIELDLLGQVRRRLFVLGRLRQLLLQDSIQLGQFGVAQSLERFGLIAGVLQKLQKLARKLERAA